MSLVTIKPATMEPTVKLAFMSVLALFSYSSIATGETLRSCYPGTAVCKTIKTDSQIKNRQRAMRVHTPASSR